MFILMKLHIGEDVMISVLKDLVFYLVASNENLLEADSDRRDRPIVKPITWGPQRHHKII